MKYFSIILATTVLFLALKPGLDLISLKFDLEQSCCASQCTPLADFENFQDQNPEDGCDGNGCNPFQVCCSNVLFFAATPFDLSVNPQIPTKRNFTYQSAYNLLITFDFWQPPQFV